MLAGEVAHGATQCFGQHLRIGVDADHVRGVDFPHAAVQSLGLARRRYIDDASPDDSARVAKEIAARHPDGVAALILSGSRGPGGSRDFARERSTAFQRLGLAYRAEYARELLAPDSRSGPVADYLERLYSDRAQLADLSSIVRMYAASEVEPEPPPESAITCPTLVIAGAEDKAWAGSVEMANAIAHAEHVTIERAGHAPNIERPLEYDAHVLRFLAAHGLMPSASTPSTAG